MSSDAHTSYEETEAGRDMRIAADTRDMYDALTENPNSPLYGVDRKKVFLLAASYGWSNGLRDPIDGDASGLFNRPTPTDQQRWIIGSLAVAEERNPFVLKDEVLTFEIAEEYANSGIRELYRIYNAPEDGFIELTTDLIKLGRDRADP